MRQKSEFVPPRPSNDVASRTPPKFSHQRLESGALLSRRRIIQEFTANALRPAFLQSSTPRAISQQFGRACNVPSIPAISLESSPRWVTRVSGSKKVGRFHNPRLPIINEVRGTLHNIHGVQANAATVHPYFFFPGSDRRESKTTRNLMLKPHGNTSRVESGEDSSKP